MKNNKFMHFLGAILLSLFIYAPLHAEGTIVIDDFRNLKVNDSTTITMDRRTVATPQGMEQYGTGFLSRTLPGFKANINYSTGENSNNGELNEINLINSVIGPVIINNESTFQVLLVDLVVDADTIIEGANNIADIAVGSIVAASGIESDTGVISVTRIEVLHNGSPYWLMTGDVLNLNESGFDIGLQSLNFISSPNNVLCSSGAFANGDKVIADILPVENYAKGDILEALTVTCYDDFTFPGEPLNPIFLNGLIESVDASQTSIVVGGTSITINIDTEIISNSGVTTLEEGMSVSVNGYEDPATNEVIASHIFIKDEPAPPPFQSFIVQGVVSNVTANDFQLDDMLITYNEATLFVEGTVANLVDGVIVEAIVQSGAQSTDALIAMQISFNPQSPPGQGMVRVVGAISNLSADNLHFTLGNETIELSDATLFVGTSLEEITEGQEVTVEGVRDTTSQAVMASLLSNGIVDLVAAHVSGSITQVNAEQTQITVDNLVINVGSETAYIEGIQADLIVGANVEISGTTNTTTSEIDAEVVFFTQVASPDYIFFSGFINEISDDKTQVTVGNTVVNIVADTKITGGNIDSLVVGLEVQIEGVINVQTNEIDASNILLPINFVSAQAPILVSDVTLSDPSASNGKVVVMGIEVKQNELTMDPSDLFTNGLAENQAIVFFGYEDSAGDIWASFVYPVEIETTPNGTTMFFISGDVSNVASDQLEVMGVNIGNLNNAVFYDANMELITEDEFLNALSQGVSVTVADAETYDRASNTLNAGSLYLLEQIEPPTQPTARALSIASAASSNVSGRGIITQFIEGGLVFISGFE